MVAAQGWGQADALGGLRAPLGARGVLCLWLAGLGCFSGWFPEQLLTTFCLLCASRALQSCIPSWCPGASPSWPSIAGCFRAPQPLLVLGATLLFPGMLSAGPILHGMGPASASEGISPNFTAKPRALWDRRD